MEFAKRVFKKPLLEITFEDVIKLFQEEQIETDFLELKSYSINTKDRALNTIKEEVCAFLNSEGGLIIWGAPKGKDEVRNDKKIKIFKGDLNPLDFIEEKDTLVNKISDGITPLPNGVRVNIIPSSDKTKSVCLIEIDKSISSPHQTGNIYYMRLDGQSRPAPHHYVEALLKEVTYPNLAGFVKFAPIRDTQHHGSIIDIEVSIWNMSPLQNELNPKFYLRVEPGELHELFDSNGTGKINKTKNGYVSTGFVPQLHYGYPVMKRFSVFYPDGFFINNARYVTFRLSFGGDLAPMKISTYEFQFSELKHFINPMTAIKFRAENKLAADIDPNLMDAAKKYLETPLDIVKEIEPN